MGIFGEREPVYIWHQTVSDEFKECSDVVHRLLTTHYGRSHFLARTSGIWFRLFGTVEVCLSVVLPLLFIYQETQTKTWLLATVSVAISLSTSLKLFWGWHEGWWTYRAQKVAIRREISEWELSLLDLHFSAAPDRESKALEVTRESVSRLFDILNTEHEELLRQINPPERVIDAVNQSRQARDTRSALQQPPV
ncbi:hypothetical protein ACIPQJ_10800 [Streptomyces sp. NPDC090082]|uniref:hypothetical protein n=1 Tax=Streptomyces sp. NPDC090082 TaxID=3365940 RepID=UPI0037F5A371